MSDMRCSHRLTGECNQPAKWQDAYAPFLFWCDKHKHPKDNPLTTRVGERRRNGK